MLSEAAWARGERGSVRGVVVERLAERLVAEKIVVPAPLSRFLPPGFLVLGEGLRAVGSARGR